MMKRLKALIRCFIWKVCPLCNSDAPKIDNCICCQNYRSAFNGPPNDKLLGNWWIRYSKFKDLDKYINHLHNELK